VARRSSKKRRRANSAAEKLKLLRQRYELVMDAINEGVYDWNVVEGTIEYSTGVQKAVGLPGAIKTLADWRNRIHPQDLPRYLAGFVDHFKGKTERYACDYRYRAADGSWRWARQHGVALRDRRGRAVRMIGSTGDITDLKRAEDALRKSDERLALATSAATEGIYEWDVETGELFVSERARQCFGIRAEKLTPAAWSTRVHAEDLPVYRLAIRDLFENRNAHLEHEYRISDGSGSYKWVLDRGMAVRNGAGQVIRMVGALTDITQRKRTELELRRARDAAQEALEQQTAIAEILRVMSGSPTDVQPVFEAIVNSGLRQFEGAGVTVAVTRDCQVQLMAIAERDPERARRWKERFPFPVTREYVHGVAILDCRMVDMPDVEKIDASFARGERDFAASGYRAMTVVPMVKDGAAIGTVAVVREAPGPLSDKQIALLKTFADQAVIAIENVRLFNETKESLARETAIADMLKMIGRSSFELQTVLDTLVESAARLCGADHGWLFQRSGEVFSWAASYGNATGVHARIKDYFRNRPLPAERGSITGRAALEGRVIHVADVLADPGYTLSEAQRIGGYRAALGIPLLREGDVVGVIVLARTAPQPFSAQQIDLATTFADQAVIAIENARLFNETREALERQTATAEILKVIAASPSDVRPVFEAVIKSASRLARGSSVNVTQLAGDKLHLLAYTPVSPAADAILCNSYPVAITVAGPLAEAVRNRTPFFVSDFEMDPTVSPAAREVMRARGYRSTLYVPIVRGETVYGVLHVNKPEPGPFPQHWIDLLKTFADQAMIAIENTRLFNEIQEKSRQLEIASRHKSEFLANVSHELRTPLNAIIGFTRIVMRRSKDRLEAKQHENLEKILSSGEQLLGLINAILDLSKIEAGRIEMRANDVPLALVLEQCVRTVEPLVKADAVTLVKEFDGGLPQMYTDEQKLRQIVINLLSNAAKFTAQGSIRVRAEATNGTWRSPWPTPESVSRLISSSRSSRSSSRSTRAARGRTAAPGLVSP
jgi:PAS domain S-box-containing protein